MKYKSEILYKSRVIYNGYFKKLSHPNQVVRNSLKNVVNKKDNFIIYVVNETGEYWRYAIRLNKGGKYEVRKMEKSNVFLPKNDVDMIFSGNKKLTSYI